MSTFIVQSVEAPQPFQSQYGPMFSVKLAGLLDNQIEPNAQINVKDASKAPVPGESLQVSFTRDSYGVKLKKLPPPPPVAAPAAIQAPLPGVAAPQPAPYPPREDPTVRQGSIERQNALSNAVAYCTAKAVALSANKQHDKALEELTGEHIVRVAIYFASFTSGKLVLPEPKLRSAVEVISTQDEPLPEEPFGEEVS